MTESVSAGEEEEAAAASRGSELAKGQKGGVLSIYYQVLLFGLKKLGP